MRFLLNDFTFSLFDFIDPTLQRRPKTQTKKYVVRMRRFFFIERSQLGMLKVLFLRIFWLGQNMENDVNS